MAKAATKKPLPAEASAPAHPAVFALVGAESLLQVEALAEIVSGVAAGAQRSDFDGNETEVGRVIEELTSYAMFGGLMGGGGAGGGGAVDRLVVVRNGDDLIKSGREALENYLKSPSRTSILVLRLESLNKTQNVAKLIAKAGREIDCDTPSPRKAEEWAIQRAAKKHGLKLSLEAASLLVERIGPNLGLLDQHLARLALGEATNIGPAQVAGEVAFQREQEMQALTQAMSSGNAGVAVARWRELIASDPSSEFRAVTWLGLWLEDVLLALREPNGARFKLAWKFKAPPPAPTLEQFLALCKGMGLPKARALQRRLTETDGAIKSGLGKGSRLVEQFVLEAAVVMGGRG